MAQTRIFYDTPQTGFEWRPSTFWECGERGKSFHCCGDTHKGAAADIDLSLKDSYASRNQNSPKLGEHPDLLPTDPSSKGVDANDKDDDNDGLTVDGNDNSASEEGADKRNDGEAAFAAEDDMPPETWQDTPTLTDMKENLRLSLELDTNRPQGSPSFTLRPSLDTRLEAAWRAEAERDALALEAEEIALLDKAGYHS